MTNINYIPTNTERSSFHMPSDNSSENKQIDLKTPVIKIFTYAAVTAVGISLSYFNTSDIIKPKFNNTFYMSDQSANPINLSKNGKQIDNETVGKSGNIDLNKLIKENKDKEIQRMQNEIKAPVIKFEKFVIKLSLLLIALFFVLSFPFLLGYPSVVGILMSLGLLIFIKIRQWERGE